MERNDGKKLKITIAAVAIGVVGLTVQAEGARKTMSASEAERTLVYGTPDGKWTSQAARLAAADDAVAVELGRIAQSTSVDDARRGMALDALAQAGSDAAQSSLRDALSSPALRNDPAYPLFVVRLGQVRSPSAATVEFVSTLRQQAFGANDGELAFATQETLDAAYGHRLAALFGQSVRHGRSVPSLTHKRGE
jgi:hypothetical protein